MPQRIPAQMRAVVYDRFGGPEVLRVDQRPVPAPAADEVLIRVAAAGVNPIDWKIRKGLFECIFDYEFPIVPGWDVAGEVAAVGLAVKGFEAGERVFAYCRKPLVHWGAYADYVPVSASAVAAMPRSLTFAQAAAMPVVALTAWQAFVQEAAVGKGDTVLVHAGAGGVGSLAIPLAAHLGATVLTTASAANADYVRNLGADVAIDYRAGDWREAVRDHAPDGLDAVLDGVGGEIPDQSLEVIKPGGTLICLNEPADDAAAEAKGIKAVRLYAMPDGAQLAEIARLFDDGVLRPPPVDEFPITEVARAHALSEQGHVKGKLVLVVD